MSQDKFTVVLGIIIPQVIELIVKNNPAYDEATAINDFYSSKIYSLLEDETTKLWHLSPLTIYDIFCTEKQTGTFELPEEV